MKKLLSVVLAFGLVLGFSACAAGGESAGSSKGDGMTLPEIMEEILKDVGELPELENFELGADQWEYNAFITPAEGMEGYASNAMMSPVAHSVVLVRVPEGADAEKVAADIEKNANPNKWICVSADQKIVRRHGNTILLVMSFDELAEPIANNFDNLFK
ncbi:MAG: hypothetical protein ACOYI3_04440 [Christensenellales bacterium]|jgi:hypothetical protein